MAASSGSKRCRPLSSTGDTDPVFNGFAYKLRRVEGRGGTSVYLEGDAMIVDGTAGTVVSVESGTGVTCSPNPITGTGTVSLSNVGPGADTTWYPSYLTLNAQGQVTALAGGPGQPNVGQWRTNLGVNPGAGFFSYIAGVLAVNLTDIHGQSWTGLCDDPATKYGEWTVSLRRNIGSVNSDLWTATGVCSTVDAARLKINITSSSGTDPSTLASNVTVDICLQPVGAIVLPLATLPGDGLMLDASSAPTWQNNLNLVFDLEVNASTTPPAGKIYVPSLTAGVYTQLAVSFQDRNGLNWSYWFQLQSIGAAEVTGLQIGAFMACEGQSTIYDGGTVNTSTFGVNGYVTYDVDGSHTLSAGVCRFSPVYSGAVTPASLAGQVATSTGNVRDWYYPAASVYIVEENVSTTPPDGYAYVDALSGATRIIFGELDASNAPSIDRVFSGAISASTGMVMTYGNAFFTFQDQGTPSITGTRFRISSLVTGVFQKGQASFSFSPVPKAGTVTTVYEGTGITCTPNPIEGTGTISLSSIANDTVLGNIAGVLAQPVPLTKAQATNLLNSFAGTIKGLVPLSGGGTVDYLRADGSWAVPPGATSGTVTSVATGTGLTGGTITSTGTLSLATIANNALLGNNSGGVAAPTAKTGTEVTALLDTFTAGLQGVCTPSGGGASNFLRADGVWSAPTGTGRVHFLSSGRGVATGTAATGAIFSSEGGKTSTHGETLDMASGITWNIYSTIIPQQATYSATLITSAASANKFISNLTSTGGSMLLEVGYVSFSASAAFTSLSSATIPYNTANLSTASSLVVTWTNASVVLPAGNVLVFKLSNNLTGGTAGTFACVFIYE